jgi:DNA-binding transcriptional LysR family regulator
MIVSLTKLRQLVTVARCESLTRAAEVLNISQPALSRAVAFIEDAYGVKIFDRISQGVVPTEAGSAIIAEAERLLRTADTFDHNASLIGGAKLGHVSFGMGPIMSNILLGKAGIALLADGKQISFRAHTRRADYLIRALLEEDLELAIVGVANFDVPDELEVRPVGVLRTAAIARPDHPMAGKSNIRIAEIREFPVASPMDLNQLRTFHPIPHNISCDDYVAMTEMAQHTDTICLCAELFARSASATGEVVMLDVDIPAEQREIEVIAMTLRGRTISPAVELIIECCREILADAVKG